METNFIMSKKAGFLLSIAFVVLTVHFGSGQADTSLSGHVKDDSGKAIPGVLVKAQIGGMTVTVPSKLDGRFQITGPTGRTS